MFYRPHAPTHAPIGGGICCEGVDLFYPIGATRRSCRAKKNSKSSLSNQNIAAGHMPVPINIELFRSPAAREVSALSKLCMVIDEARTILASL